MKKHRDEEQDKHEKRKKGQPRAEDFYDEDGYPMRYDADTDEYYYREEQMPTE